MELVEDIKQLVNLDAIRKLPNDTKRAIIEAIEDTFEEDEIVFEDNAEETEEELKILDDRLEHHKLNPGKAISWDDLKKQLLNQNG